MKRSQLLLLFLCGLLAYWVGMGLMPLLPIYAAQLSASPSVVGNYLSSAFLTLTLGTAATGWLAARVQRRHLLAATCLAAAPSAWFMGQSATIWQLAISTGLLWLVAGSILALISILAGRNAGADERGKVFGVLALASAFAAVFGNLVTGFIADRWGYPVLFGVIASNYLLLSALALRLEDSPAPTEISPASGGPSPAGRAAFSPALILITTANLLLGAAMAFITMGRSLAMDAQGFSATTITVTGAVGALVGIVMNPLLGRISDRVNRRLLVALAYGCAAAALAATAGAQSAAAFTFASLLMTFAGTERAVAPALVTDLVRREDLDRSMALYDAARWSGSIVGFLATGYAIQMVGVSASLLLSALLPAAGVGLIAWARSPQETRLLPSDALPAGETPA